MKTPKSLEFLCMEIWAGKNLFLCLIVQVNTCRVDPHARAGMIKGHFAAQIEPFSRHLRGKRGDKRLHCILFRHRFFDTSFARLKAEIFASIAEGGKRGKTPFVPPYCERHFQYRTHITSHKKRRRKRPDSPCLLDRKSVLLKSSVYILFPCKKLTCDFAEKIPFFYGRVSCHITCLLSFGKGSGGVKKGTRN